MKQYDVVFVVDGWIPDVDAPIGTLECNGTVPVAPGRHDIKDGRAYYPVKADSPEDAYRIALERFESDDFGELHFVDSRLEHVERDGTYWYPEDLEMEIQK